MNPTRGRRSIAFPVCSLSSLVLAVVLNFSTTVVAAQGPSSAPDTPSAPAIFGIGFTNITDTSARLVFTTSEPMSTSVEVLDGTARVRKLEQPAFEEIHAVLLSGLSRQTKYRIVISATGKTGSIASQQTMLRPILNPLSRHLWPGYTIFSSTASDNPDALELLAKSGVRMARVEISWDGVFPRKGELNRAYLDHWLVRIAEMRKRNIEPLVLLDYCVSWAKPDTDTTMTWRNKNFGPPDQLADWEEYVRTVVSALHGSARYYEVWNEPDAGYLATGSFVERLGLPPPIGRAPFKDYWDYWIGDRYVPMIEAARKVIDEIEPNAIVMNGGWNRDYSGQRGDIMLQRGAGSYLDLYAFHVYTHSPISFSRWYREIDGGFRTNIDRIFVENHIDLPLAVTEWGTPAWITPPEGRGFATFDDSKLFYIKSTFYFLSMERFEILSQFDFGVGPSNREKDPTFFMLVNEDRPHHPLITPTYLTFQWLAKTFGSRPYHALPVQVTGKPEVQAYAIQMQDSGEIYLAAWQDGPVDGSGAITPLAGRNVSITIRGVSAGSYRAYQLDLDGKTHSHWSLKAGSALMLQASLPPATSTAESRVYLARIVSQTKSTER